MPILLYMNVGCPFQYDIILYNCFKYLMDLMEVSFILLIPDREPAAQNTHICWVMRSNNLRRYNA